MTNIILPLEKHLVINDKYEPMFLNYSKYTELPIQNHPGSFGYVRKNHIHEGIDFYCEKSDPVLAIENGTVVNICMFTGPQMGSPWWNTTYCALVEGDTGVFNYGEILVHEHLHIGKKIKRGDCIGYVETVLTKDKGRPMNMLHLELYSHGTTQNIEQWSLHEPKPEKLLDPTGLFLNFSS